KGQRKLDRAPDALRAVVTDKYFRDIHDETKTGRITKARTMSWALTYFLMNKRLDQVLRYYQELNNLPRYLEFDDETLLLTFARSFDLLVNSNPYQVDDRKLNKLADEWYSF